MKIHAISVGAIQTNCYVVETDLKNAVIIDCGDEAQRLLQFCRNNGLVIKKILLTHGHFDHIGAVSGIVKETDAGVFIHKNDSLMLTDGQLNLSYMISSEFTAIDSYTEIADGSVISQDELTFKAIHTPGHTSGSVCFVCGDAIFSGDTVFQGSVGRTDFPGGSFELIKNSVDKISALEGDFNIFPGHGASTTLNIERRTNLYFGNNYNDSDF